MQAAGASSAILAPLDIDWTHYASAKRFSSLTGHVSLRNIAGIEVVKVAGRIVRTYDSCYTGYTQGVTPGLYMPNVSVQFDTVRSWIAFSVDGTAGMSQITNCGPVGGLLIL